MRNFAWLLTQQGYEVTGALEARISRADFDAGLFLPCLSALGAKRITLDVEVPDATPCFS